MGGDESGTLARLRKNRCEHLDPVLAKYGRRLVKLTGDGAPVLLTGHGPAAPKPQCAKLHIDAGPLDVPVRDGT